MREGQLDLIEVEEEWRRHWVAMPEYTHDDLTAYRSIVVHFESELDAQAFAAAIGQELGARQKSTWFPAQPLARYADKRYADDSTD